MFRFTMYAYYSSGSRSLSKRSSRPGLMRRRSHIALHLWSVSMLLDKFGTVAYGRFLIVIAGFGGLLYGIDIGVIAAALLYLSKTVSLTLAQTSIIVAAVLGGSMVSSLIAGLLADCLGRR